MGLPLAPRSPYDSPHPLPAILLQRPRDGVPRERAPQQEPRKRDILSDKAGRGAGRR